MHASLLEIDRSVDEIRGHRRRRRLSLTTAASLASLMLVPLAAFDARAAGLAVTGGVFASAASLGGVESANLGSSATVVASCDTDGVTVDYSTAYDSASGTYLVNTEEPYKDQKAKVTADFEARYARLLMKAHQGNVSAASRVAGIDRMSLHEILARYGLDARELGKS